MMEPIPNKDNLVEVVFSFLDLENNPITNKANTVMDIL